MNYTLCKYQVRRAQLAFQPIEPVFYTPVHI
jgi:hypothetical protein